MQESQSSPVRLLLTAREAAQVLCLSARKLWGLTASGEIPCVRIWRSVRYSARELERFVVVRFDTPTGKTFRPIRRTPKGWRIGAPPGSLPLYLRPEMAEALQEHLAARTGKDAVFTLPSKFNMADMLRADLAAARCAWLTAAVDDPHELARRQNSDFLADVNHEGHVLDFHSLRHTCGAWLAIAGAHPKEIQTVMRHSTITLTMDTYGHLVPGQEALTIARLPCLLDVPKNSRRIG